eukprot:scaffold8728_cov164-Amphora_coffeaeformis.AAC.17
MSVLCCWLALRALHWDMLMPFRFGFGGLDDGGETKDHILPAGSSAYRLKFSTDDRLLRLCPFENVLLVPTHGFRCRVDVQRCRRAKPYTGREEYYHTYWYPTIGSRVHRRLPFCSEMLSSAMWICSILHHWRDITISYNGGLQLTKSPLLLQQTQSWVEKQTRNWSTALNVN